MLVCPLGVERKVAETMPVAQCSPLGQAAGLGLLGIHRKAEHGGFPLPYTEIFSDHILRYMADLVTTQIKRVYVLHSPQS